MSIVFQKAAQTQYLIKPIVIAVHTKVRSFVQ